MWCCDTHTYLPLQLYNSAKYLACLFYGFLFMGIDFRFSFCSTFIPNLCFFFLLVFVGEIFSTAKSQVQCGFGPLWLCICLWFTAHRQTHTHKRAHTYLYRFVCCTHEQHIGIQMRHTIAVPSRTESWMFCLTAILRDDFFSLHSSFLISHRFHLVFEMNKWHQHEHEE